MTSTELENMDDLEDGEIESDAEGQNEEQAVPALPVNVPEPAPYVHEESDKSPPKASTKAEKRREKKKLKEYHKEEKEYKSHKKDKSRKFLLPTPVEDDFAGNIEKAIRMALKKGIENDINMPVEAERFEDDCETKRKHKKRKKHDQSDKESSKKRRKREESRIKGNDEMDEDEMMCVRGASPVLKQESLQEELYDNYQSEEDYNSDESTGSRGRERRNGARGGRGGGGRGERRSERSRARPRRQDTHPQQDPDGVCLFYMQGKCYKGEECTYSHDAQPPRKMELCKFYLMDCCAKRDKCLYLHSDFPCKYYHTGLPCTNKDDCKFAHGKPLSENLKNILLKHIESAPKEILGDFPRLSRDSAAMMVALTQNKLLQQYSPTKSNNNKDKGIPSILELNVPKPVGYEETQIYMNDHHSSHHSEKHKNLSKVRQSRWCDNPNPSAPLLSTPPPNNIANRDILNIHNLNGVLTQHQISELVNLGIENLNQLSQLTVIQLNQLGLTMNQINEIQLNTMSIQKLGLIHNQSSNNSSAYNNVKNNKDLDMRVSPMMPDLKPNPHVNNEGPGQDVDMRFQHNRRASSTDDKHSRNSDPRKNKHSIDIDQYTKDALKFSKYEKGSRENSDGEFNNEDQSSNHNRDSDIDHRVLSYVRDASLLDARLCQEDDIKNESDSDARISISSKSHESNFQKKIEQKARRTTTDDDEEDDNLQIDEKWYSSDEDRCDKNSTKSKSPPQSEHPKIYAPPIDSESNEPCTVITKLGDLSKIDISAEVTKLLSSIKNNTPSENINDSTKKEVTKSRDPRNIKKSPERKSSTEVKKTEKAPKPGFVSIYNCVEGGSSDGRKRTDIDLRPIQDIDFRLPSFGDTDLRQTPGSGDVDLRLSLPFKAIPNYTPASEIDGSINSHPPITFKLSIVDVPRPDYTDIKNSTPKSQAESDPRLRKIFRLSIEENPLDTSEKSAKSVQSVRIDPRKRVQESNEKPNTVKSSPLDIQAIIQSSNWYKELGSNQKILVNQQLATVTTSLKKFHQDGTPGKLFDLTEIKSNIVLTSIFTNLGIILNEKGEYTQLKMTENAPPVMPPMNFNPDNFPGGNMPGLLDPMGMMGMNPMGPNNMGSGNMGPGNMGPGNMGPGNMGPGNMGPGNMGPGNMGPGNMGPMSNFDMRFPGVDPRGAPGLLGIAPNIPHNFEGGNFNGMPNSRMPNFSSDNSSRMPPFNTDNDPRMSNFNNENFNSNFDNSSMYNNSVGNNEFRGDSNYEDNNYYRGQKNEYSKPYRGGRGGERWRGARGRDRRGYSERGGGGGGGGGWKGDRR